MLAQDPADPEETVPTDTLGIWLVEDRTDRADAALQLAVAWRCPRLQLPADAWTQARRQAATEAGVEALALEDDAPVAGGQPVAAPRMRTSYPWLRDGFRRACEAEFAARAGGSAGRWVTALDRVSPAASVEGLIADLRMHLVGAWAGGAAGVRLGPLPGWDELDLYGEAPSPMRREIERLQEAQQALSSGSFSPSRVVLLEPDEPDDEDLRRTFEAWLLWKLAGVTPRRVPASEARRRVLNQASMVVVPGCWRLPEATWVTLGGWVRGGGTLWLGFDDRALAEGYEPGCGPPGPGFLARLVGREPVGAPPFSEVEADWIRLRFPRGNPRVGDMREVRLSCPPGVLAWPLAELARAAPRGRRPRKDQPQALAESPGLGVTLWDHPLDRGRVIATSVPLEALLARSPDAHALAPGNRRAKARPPATDLSRVLHSLARAAGACEGPVPVEPFTELRLATGKGGFPHGALVVNRRNERAPGRLPLPDAASFDAQDLLAGKPVALMHGKLVCPVEASDYRVLGLRPRR